MFLKCVFLKTAYVIAVFFYFVERKKKEEEKEKEKASLEAGPYPH